jgi:hypothetical protein
LVQVGTEASDLNHWDVGPIAPSTGSNERARIREFVDGNIVGDWGFERIDGVWTIAESFPAGTVSIPPAIPDGFEFFTEKVVALALAEATPGAAIFYTKNSSTPAPRNPAGFLFLGTFNADPGSTVRARAWLPGYIPSAELKVTL